MSPRDPARWELRFVNFCKAEGNLAEAVETFRARPLSVLEQAGMVQLFEVAWDLGWKVMRDYLVENGVADEVATPIGAIRAAFAAGLIADGQDWIDATKLRNVLSHEYNSERAGEGLKQIANRHLAMFRALAEKLGDEQPPTDLP